MPHASSDVSSNDEVKVYRVEGEGDDESSAENLKEEKRSLLSEVALKEESRGVEVADRSIPISAPQHHLPHHVGAFAGEKPFGYFPPTSFGYVPSYTHSRTPYGGLPMVGRVPLVPSNHPQSPLSFMMYGPDHQFQPPPAHMGIHIDPKTGMPRPPVFPLAPSQFHTPVFPPDYSQQFSWHHSYPVSSGFRSPPYPLAVSPLFNPLMPLVPTPKTQNMQEGRNSPFLNNAQEQQQQQQQQKRSPRNNEKNKKSHIKKPLNAFMLYMKEQRPQVVAECTLKESAAINQILGKRWHSLSREEQSKYYELARNERQLHMQRYPGWTARDNYAINIKKKKRKRDKSQDADGNNPKKCRARFGLDRQSSWCKPCRRKKKCIRYRSGSDNTAGESEDNVGSVGSAQTPDSRYGGEDQEEDLSDTDSGHEEDASSEFSLSSPRPSSLERVQSANNLPLGSPPSQQSSHPLNVQALSQPYMPKIHQEQLLTRPPQVLEQPLSQPHLSRLSLEADEQHLSRLHQASEQMLQRTEPHPARPPLTNTDSHPSISQIVAGQLMTRPSHETNEPHLVKSDQRLLQPSRPTHKSTEQHQSRTHQASEQLMPRLPREDPHPSRSHQVSELHQRRSPHKTMESCLSRSEQPLQRAATEGHLLPLTSRPLLPTEMLTETHQTKQIHFPQTEVPLSRVHKTEQPLPRSETHQKTLELMSVQQMKLLPVDAHQPTQPLPST